MKKLIFCLTLFAVSALAQGEPTPEPTPTPSPTPFVVQIPTPEQVVTLKPISFYMDAKMTEELQQVVFGYLMQKGATVPTIPENQMVQQFVVRKNADLSSMVSVFYTQSPSK